MKPEDPNDRPLFRTGTGMAAPEGTYFPLIRQLREALLEFLHPASPIAITATPVPVADIWSRNESHIPGLLSLLVHVAVVAVLIVLSVISYTKPKAIFDDALLMSSYSLIAPSMAPAGGGGGGTRSLTLASKGILPPADNKQLVPPTPIITNMAPELAVVPTIVSLQMASLPPIASLIPVGLPTGISGPPSGGKGKGFGIGDDGDGRGVGDQKGPGGLGECCGNGPNSPNGPPGLRANSPGVTPPSCAVQVEPNYTDDARKARVQGTVLLVVTIEKDGSVQPNRVVQGLGYGLDEEAQRVLNRWKCTAGKYNGQAVAIPVQVQVNFRLF